MSSVGMAPLPIVLTVESEQREAHSLAAAVRDPRWEVATAADASSAILLARDGTPKIIIVSSRALGGGGLAALKRLRLSAHTAAIPVIGVAGIGMRDALLEAGAAECLPETTPPAKLREAVAQHLGNRRVVLKAPADVLSDPARIAALNKTGLLDSQTEEAYDRVTRIASHLLEVPTMLVSLVDHDRQFFKSQIGLPERFKRETPLTHSLCQWVVSSREDLIVSDVRQNEALRDNRAVEELSAVAYAGVMLAAPGGEAIGTLCAIDSHPRKWSEEELATLGDLRDVTQAYVALGNQSANKTDAAPAVRNAVTAASRILIRENPRFTDSDGADVVAVIADLSTYLHSPEQGFAIRQ